MEQRDAAGADSPKVRATKWRIVDALFDLLGEDTIDRITVAEVCAKARVNRSTFYRHFVDLYAACDYCKNEVLEHVSALMGKRFVFGVMAGRTSAMATLMEDELSAYYRYLNVLLNGRDPAFVEEVRRMARSAIGELLPLDGFSERQDIIFSAVSSMYLGLYARWLATGRRMPLKDLLALHRSLALRGPRVAMLRG